MRDKHQIIEEPCEVKVSRTVLKTSGTGDSLAEFNIFGKKVLRPLGRSQINYQANRIYAIALTMAQADALPEYQEPRALDYDDEEQVRGVYRTQQAAQDATEKAAKGSLTFH